MGDLRFKLGKIAMYKFRTFKSQTLLLLFSLGFIIPQTTLSESKDEADKERPYFSEPLPGVEQFDSKLISQLIHFKRQRGTNYEPRTRHLRTDGWAKFTNRLFLETSPYLLQHAHNPVNWYPWGDEAFENARKLNRPVLLSVGYSTCHWCHVMEEESFEDEEIARYLNQNYVAIKVDREERPDIDGIYMAAVQAISGSGGWPMTVWLTPDKKPYFGGTYFPPRDGLMGARPGFLTLLKKLRAVFDQDPKGVESSGERLAASIKAQLHPVSGVTSLRADYISDAISAYRKSFDSNYGGIGYAPKFPSSLPVRLVLRHYRRNPDDAILKMATKTLDAMSSGGMYDHVAGGFHRYSTDERWLVPHFEKMLYDNALLVPAYLEAFQITANPAYKQVADETLNYLLRDMRSSLGGFYSATDADSMTPSGKREEGWFFTWTEAEFDQYLSKDESLFAKRYFNLTRSGNFEGRNILHTPRLPSEIAKSLSISHEQAEIHLKNVKAKLYEARNKRPLPLRDEKILTAWNGLAISALAKGALILSEIKYLEAASQTAEFILKNLYRNDKLYRTFKDGQAKNPAYLEDYAFLVAGLLDLYEASGEPKWIESALELTAILTKEFEHKETGGFFMTSHNHEKLIAREKPAYDGAEPNGNSIAILNLLRLHELTTDEAFRAKAERALKAFSVALNTNPTALSEMLIGLDFYLDKPKEIVIVTDRGRESEREPFLSELRSHFLPNRVVSLLTLDDNRHERIVPYLKGKVPRNGKATAYVCEQGLCKLPTADASVFGAQIRGE